MSIPPDMAERHARVLARLTELGLALAERTFEDAEAAETPAERLEAVKAFHTTSRSVRQSVALEAKLARQQDNDAREAAWAAALSPPPRPDVEEMRRRIHTVRDAVARVIWHEAEDDDSAIGMPKTLEDDLDAECLRDDAWAEPLDDVIVRLCVEMGFPEDVALAWRDLPDDDPPDEAEEAFSLPPDAVGPEPQPQPQPDGCGPSRRRYRRRLGLRGIPCGVR